MAQLNFDASQVEPDTGFDTVPVGWYNVSMDESDLKPTKDGAGTYLQARFNILDGQYRGRKLFTRLNIRNANAQAQEIALRQLSAIGHAVGILQIQDSQQLHGHPLKVKVKIRKGDDQYEDQNEIISYKNINEPVETVGSGSGAGAPPQGFAPPAQQPQTQWQQPQQPPAQQFQQPPAQQQTWQPPVQQQQPPQQQFAPPPQEQPQQQAQQPWAQPPLQQAPPPQQDPSNPFQGQPQQNQQQPWNGGAPQQGAPAQQGQPPVQQDPHPNAQPQAQQAPPPWANQGNPQ